ncbi:MAG: hypothetical protein ACRYFS_25310 [Janthinobacterium lividum]
MKKTHSLSTSVLSISKKKPRLISNTHLILLLIFAFLFLFGLPALIVGAVVFPTAIGPPVNWKIATAFLVLFNGWWFYVLYRRLRVKLAQREAVDKQRTRTA